MCRLFFLKSTIFSPDGSLMYASLIFHSFGTVQSNTFVPVGTSLILSGTCVRMIERVLRTPFPVMLRHIGKRRLSKASISLTMCGPLYMNFWPSTKNNGNFTSRTFISYTRSMKILLMWGEKEPTMRGIFDALQKEGHEIVYWVGGYGTEHLAPQGVPFHDHFEAWAALPSKDLERQHIRQYRLRDGPKKGHQDTLFRGHVDRHAHAHV